MIVRFSDFALDTATRELRQDGRPVHLTPKAFELLIALVEKRPEVVAKRDLQERLWPGTHVGETSLAGVVAELRSALGDARREANFIRTVHGFGYAFAAAVEAAPTATAGATVCGILVDGRQITLHSGENLLGRDPAAVAWLDSTTVSRRHARILVGTEGATLEDLGSHNGTYHRGARIKAPVRLADHDEIRLGSVSLVFRVLDAGETQSEGHRE